MARKAVAVEVKKVPVGVSLPPALRDALEDCRWERHESMSSLISSILVEWATENIGYTDEVVED